MLVAFIGFGFMKIPKKSFETLDVLKLGSEISEKPLTFGEITKLTAKLIFTEKMMLLNLQLLWTGVSIAYWSGLLILILIEN